MLTSRFARSGGFFPAVWSQAVGSLSLKLSQCRATLRFCPARHRSILVCYRGHGANSFMMFRSELKSVQVSLISGRNSAGEDKSTSVDSVR
jgi:hypothetical protein